MPSGCFMWPRVPSGCVIAVLAVLCEQEQGDCLPVVKPACLCLQDAQAIHPPLCCLQLALFRTVLHKTHFPQRVEAHSHPQPCAFSAGPVHLGPLFPHPSSPNLNSGVKLRHPANITLSSLPV